VRDCDRICIKGLRVGLNDRNGFLTHQGRWDGICRVGCILLRSDVQFLKSFCSEHDTPLGTSDVQFGNLIHQ